MNNAAGYASDAMVQSVVDRTVELCGVPGPPLDEAERARVVANWWRNDGLADVRSDEVGNVWARVRDGDGPTILVAAHLDTVFEPADHRRPEIDGDYLRAPSVGDDSVALAALSTLSTLLPSDTVHPVAIVATVGEEGIGNLAGITHALAADDIEFAAVVAVEGNYLGRVCTTGVGSERWRVTLDGPGGHAWEHAAVPSAVHEAARVIYRLDENARPDCTVNVGIVRGGEAINVRARRATFDVDFRATSPQELEHAVQAAREVLQSCDACSVQHEVIGRRPAGSIVRDHPLVESATRALVRHNRGVTFTAASTDANAAHAMGVPAVTIGVTEGGQEHTLEEWIRIDPLRVGLVALAETVELFDRSDT